MSIIQIDEFIKNCLKRRQRCHFHQFLVQISHLKYMETVRAATRIEVRASVHEPRQNRRFYRKLVKTASEVSFSPISMITFPC